MADTTTPHTTGDADLDRLTHEQAVSEARARLAAVRTAALGSLAPGVTDAPKGEVTLGAKAGSLAPWLTQQVLADCARQIAESVRALRPAAGPYWRVLVTADVNLLNTDVHGQLIQSALSRRTDQLDQLPKALADAKVQLDSGVADYEAGPRPRRLQDPRRMAPAQSETARKDGTGDEEGEKGEEQVTTADGGTGDEEGEEGEEQVTTAEPLAAAVQLVRLIATDFTVTAAAIDADASLLALLTAGALGQGQPPAQAAGPGPGYPTMAPARTALLPGSGTAAEQHVAAAEAAAEEAKSAADDARAAAEATVDAVAAKITELIGSAVRPGAEAAALLALVDQAANQTLATAHAVAAKTGTLDVVLDGFDVSYSRRPTFMALKSLATRANAVGVATLDLRSMLAPFAAKLATRKIAMEAAQSEWTKAATDAKVDQTRVDQLKERLDDLTADFSRLQALVSPVQTVLDQAGVVIEAARSDLVAVTTADASGVSPIARACAREALHLPDADKITHVLYVHPTHAGADVVTRRSVLGSSGRVSYLGGANAAWALLNVADGNLAGGGATEQARQLSHDMTTGKTSTVSPISPDAVADLGEDPLTKHEQTIRTAILVLAFGVSLLGVLVAVGLALGGIF